jgi:hypothetical protein
MQMSRDTFPEEGWWTAPVVRGHKKNMFVDSPEHVVLVFVETESEKIW